MTTRPHEVMQVDASCCNDTVVPLMRCEPFTDESDTLDHMGNLFCCRCKLTTIEEFRFLCYNLVILIHQLFLWSCVDLRRLIKGLPFISFQDLHMHNSLHSVSFQLTWAVGDCRECSAVSPATEALGHH